MLIAHSVVWVSGRISMTVDVCGRSLTMSWNMGSGILTGPGITGGRSWSGDDGTGRGGEEKKRLVRLH